MSFKNVNFPGPPHIVSSYEKRPVFRYGDLIKLECPVRGFPQPIINWKKDGESVTIGWDRYRTSGQTLRIKEATQDDSGTFECVGVNGFGSETVSFQVIVLDPKYGSVSPSDFLPPTISEFSKTPDSLVQLTVGATLRLRCVAEGFPEPTLMWYRDGREVAEDTRSSRWSLQVDRVRIEDTGEYTCVAKNPLGLANATFQVEVTDRAPRQPEFSGDLVSNQSAQEGTTVRLQCKVKSDDEPFIQWLKRVESDSSNTHFFPISEAPITFGNWRYRVVKTGRVSARSEDGAYVDRLIFDPVSNEDTGTYVCVATNSVGYSFREAYVNVLPRIVPSDKGPLDPIQTSSLDSTAIIILPVASIALIAIVALCVYCLMKNRFQQKPPRRQYTLPTEQATPCLPTPGSNFTEGHYAVPIDNCNHHREKRVVYPQVTYKDGRYPHHDQSGYLEPIQIPYTGSYPLLRDNYTDRKSPTYIVPGAQSQKSGSNVSQNTPCSTGYIKCNHHRRPDIV